MKAMCLANPSPIAEAPLRLCDVDPPLPGDGEVRIRVNCCAICRTDLHVIEGDLPRQRLPVVPGHQAVGVVEETGPRCTRLRAGDRIGIPWLRHTCGSCTYCLRGRENLCENSRFTGYHEDGGYAEFAVVPEGFAYRIPACFTDTEAAPLLCAGVIGYRALLRANVPHGGKLLLVGFGSSAHIVLQIARHRRCDVYVVTRGEGHRRLARDMGAAWVGDDFSAIPAKADSAILFAPVGALVPPMLESLEKGGTLALAGIHMSDVPAMNYQQHLFFERDIRSVTANTREDGEALFEEAAAASVKPHTTSYSLADANRALLDLRNDRINGTGVLLVR